MNRRSLIPALLFVFSVLVITAAKPSPVSTNPRLAEILRLPALQPQDWQALFSMAESGDAEAQYWLGKVYRFGLVLTADMEESNYWFQKSASQGYAPAEYVLCQQRAEPDTLDNERCLWRAAENDVPDAQFWLGVAFDDHRFGVTDEAEALKWFRKAAEGGHPDAEWELGFHYEWGDGVQQDYSQAAFWYRRAAEHVPNLGGAGHGRNQLGLLYLDGHGVPRDYVQAYMWFILAGFEDDYIKSTMTPEQIAQARQLAADWKKQHPDPAIY